MTKPKDKPSYECRSGDYTLNSLRVYYAGNDSYLIRAVISDRWTLSTEITKAEYHQYRDTFYTDPTGAKNYLLDLLPWDGYPFARDAFQFVNIEGPLSEEALTGLIQFVSMIE